MQYNIGFPIANWMVLCISDLLITMKKLAQFG